VVKTHRGSAICAVTMGNSGGRTRTSGQIEALKENGVVEALKENVNALKVHSRYEPYNPISRDYNMPGTVLGTGMSGPVQQGTRKSDGKKKAIKSFKLKGLTKPKLDQLRNEVAVYLDLDHPHVTRLEMVYEEDDKLYLVMECMEGGELYTRLSKLKRYTEFDGADCLSQMLLALKYLHEMSPPIAHRDLKLENFLYEQPDTNHLKLIDFGFAKHRDGDKKLVQACGTAHYVAPEVLERSYTEKADCWSLGVLAYMLLTGSPPFAGNDKTVLAAIRIGKPTYNSRFYKLSENAQDFVKQLLVKDPSKRMTAEQAMNHRFVQCKDDEFVLGNDVKDSFENFARASHFKRATFFMMAWSLDQTERAAVRDEFMKLDKNKSGSIRHVDFVQVVTDNFQINNMQAEEWFGKMDLNHDDSIEYSEFLASMVEARVTMHEDMLTTTFERFDTDRSGFITLDNLKEVLAPVLQTGDRHAIHAEDLIKEADKNHDGQISMDEFCDYFGCDVTHRKAKTTNVTKWLPCCPPCFTGLFVKQKTQMQKRELAVLTIDSLNKTTEQKGPIRLKTEVSLKLSGKIKSQTT